MGLKAHAPSVKKRPQPEGSYPATVHTQLAEPDTCPPKIEMFLLVLF
jgi:hypothetical protein